jgi:putative DNA primase/helicase
MTAAEAISNALDGKPKSGGGYMACCPAHDDRNPSLSIDDGDNGRPLVNCLAGCAQSAVIDALKQRGAWPDNDRTLSPEERQGFKEAAEKTKAERIAKDKAKHEDATKKAVKIYENAKGDPAQHPYAIKKSLPFGDLVKRGAWPQKGWGDALLFPIYSNNGTLTSIQAINADGDKDFLAGGRIKGCFYPIGKISGATGLVVIGEGVATVAAVFHVMGCPGVAAMSSVNLEPVAREIRQLAPLAEIIIIADDDQKPGGHNPGKEAAMDAAHTIKGKMAIPTLGKKADAWDVWHEQGEDGVKTMMAAAVGTKSTCGHMSTKPPAKQIVGIDIGAFLQREFPPRTNLLSPWLPAQGLTMVYAYRGIGKTFFALSVAYAVASGGSYLGWDAPFPVGVIYIDGEMPGPVMQERLAATVRGNDKEASAPLIIVNPDLQPEGMPRIDTEEGQTAIESLLTDEIKLIVIDNISTLAAAKENEADGWTPVQGWALKQRAAGRSILFIHHSGKGGAQRGTSRREDVLDTVIALRRPADYLPDQGAVFEIHFEKNRGLYGDDVKSIEATLSTDEQGLMTWRTRTVEDSTFDRVVSLLNEGIKQSDIAEELGINKSNVSRHAKKAKAMGLIDAGK